MRGFHRFLAVFAVFLGLYVAGLGAWLQAIDLKTLLSHAAETDPNLQAIREGSDGPPNFQVRVNSDIAAAALPADLNYDAAVAAVDAATHAAAPGAPISFLELRMADGKPVGQVSSKGKLLKIDAVTGAVLVGPDKAPKVKLPPGGGQPALRNTVKNLHRWTAYGDNGAFAFVIVALVLLGALFSGLYMYARLFMARARMGRPGLFWFAGGWWRTLHRGVAIAASVFLVVVVTSGALEAVGDASVSAYRVAHHGARPGLTADVSKPLTDAELPAMLHAALTAFRAADPGDPIKVIRLRYFAGMPQGVVVSGGAWTRQFAYNTATGGTAPLSGPNYPFTGQPFGWDGDQFIKGIHRGDAFGLTGRWMSLLTGLSFLFLCLSGAANYFELWNRRRKAGHAGLFWP